MIYGVQYHPEKNVFEYGLYPNTTIPYENINHSMEGITFSLYLSKFFVQNVVKQNIMNKYHHQGTSKYTKPDQYPLIYTYPRKIGYKFEEIYIIPSSATNNNNNDDIITGNDRMNEQQDQQQQQQQRFLLRRQPQP